MRMILMTVATFLMIFQECHKLERHEHVHCESPEWETLNEASVRISGDSSTGASIFYWKVD